MASMEGVRTGEHERGDIGLKTEIMRAREVLVGAKGSRRALSMSFAVVRVVLYRPVGGGSVRART